MLIDRHLRSGRSTPCEFARHPSGQRPRNCVHERQVHARAQLPNSPGPRRRARTAARDLPSLEGSVPSGRQRFGPDPSGHRRPTWVSHARRGRAGRPRSGGGTPWRGGSRCCRSCSRGRSCCVTRPARSRLRSSDKGRTLSCVRNSRDSVLQFLGGPAAQRQMQFGEWPWLIPPLPGGVNEAPVHVAGEDDQSRTHGCGHRHLMCLYSFFDIRSPCGLTRKSSDTAGTSGERRL